MIFQAADILLPARGLDLNKWSVVACDQYTSNIEYWNQVQTLVGDAPSTYHIIFPEAYLESVDPEKKICDINHAMAQYLENGILESHPDTFIAVKRTVSGGRIRRGLVGKVDLMAYDYHKGSSSPVRATEGTVESRIPPRVNIRRNAPLEVPHVMLLFDDKEDKVFSSIQEDGPLAYQFSLMQGGGKIEGRFLTKDDKERVISALEKYSLEPTGAKDVQTGRVVYAVGDGNHSLAAAKACFEEVRSTIGDEAASKHPSRWALCELVNIHDSALEFEPIHRVLFGCDVEGVLSRLHRRFPDAVGQEFSVVYQGGNCGLFAPYNTLPVGELQAFLDEEIERFGGKVDYIHGREETIALGEQPGNLGFLLPAMDKQELFPAVERDGALPRKTFSMGEANEKRFYLECRKIQ